MNVSTVAAACERISAPQSDLTIEMLIDDTLLLHVFTL